MRIVHYRILSVKVRGSDATVEVTGELGRETLWLIRTPGHGWQVDGLYRFRTPAAHSPRTRSATA
jgi:hypothetical protein